MCGGNATEGKGHNRKPVRAKFAEELGGVCGTGGNPKWHLLKQEGRLVARWMGGGGKPG